MNEVVTKKLNLYKRRLEEEKIIIFLYSVILILTIIVYIFLGAVSFYQFIKEKYNTIGELSDLNANLSQKVDTLINLEKEIVNVEPYLEDMYKKVTFGPELESYMVSLVRIAARSGFEQKKFVATSVSNDNAVIRAIFKGNVHQFPELIRNLEDNERLSKINSISMDEDNEISSVEIELTIYFVNKNI